MSDRIAAGIVQGGSGDSRTTTTTEKRKFWDFLRLQQEGKIDKSSTTLKGWIALTSITILMILVLWFIKKEI